MSDENSKQEYISVTAYFKELLREHDLRYEQRYLAQERAVNAAVIASEKALQKVEAAVEKRFDSVNEFRQTLSDQTRTFVPRMEFEVVRDALRTELARVSTMLESLKGHSSGLASGWVYLISIVSLAQMLVTAYVLLSRK
jgi:hypothetical protein